MDKHLDEEWLTLIQPILKKSPKWILSEEYVGTPDRHYHLILEFKGDITHLKQKFNSKSFKAFKNRIESEDLQTKWDKALDLKVVANNDEEYTYTVGYVSKENVKHSKDYTEEEITKAVQYYHLSRRNQAVKDKSGWKILNTKTVIPWMEKVAAEEGIEPYDLKVPIHMAKRKIFIDVQDKTLHKIQSTLYCCYTEEEDFKYKCHEQVIQGSDDPDNKIHYINYLEQENQKLKQLLKNHNIDF